MRPACHRCVAVGPLNLAPPSDRVLGCEFSSPEERADWRRCGPAGGAELFNGYRKERAGSEKESGTSLTVERDTLDATAAGSLDTSFNSTGTLVQSIGSMGVDGIRFVQ